MAPISGQISKKLFAMMRKYSLTWDEDVRGHEPRLRERPLFFQPHLHEGYGLRFIYQDHPRARARKPTLWAYYFFSLFLFLFSRTLIGASSKSKKTCPQTMRDSWWSVCSPPFHSTITQLPSHLHVPYSEFFCDEKSNNKKFIMSWNNIRNDTCVALFRAIIP